MSKNITIENARIIYRNFSGTESKYNPKGSRNFSVVLEEPVALELKKDGWNVKPLRKRDEEDPQRYHLPVSVVFGVYPPKVVAIQGKKKVTLTDETVATLDWADIYSADLIIRPRNWENHGVTGVKAYLKCGYFLIEENELDKKYAEYDSPELEDEDTPF